MSKYAVAKVFIVDNEDYIVSGEKDLVQKYIDGLYEDYCIRKDLESTDECHRCDICESLMSQGGRQECPVLVTSHEVNLSEEDYEDALNDCRKDMPWAEVINLF